MKINITKQILILTILTLFAIPNIFSQKNTDANITGHVIDGKTGEHLPFINIIVKGTTIGVLTDATGHFFLKNLPVGKFTITASCLGYETVEKDVEMMAEHTAELNFTLKAQSINLNTVVVSSSRSASDRKEAASIVNVVSKLQFESVAAGNLSETLNFTSGLRVENTCSNCGVTQLRINGLDGQYSQILLDSRPIFSSLASVYGLEQLPIAMIERVEVLRGGGSALFGSNAIAGVVNIITKEPLRNYISLSNTTNLISGRKFDQNTAINGTFVSEDYKMGVYLFGQIRNRQAYDHNKDGFSDIPLINSETVGFRSYFKTSTYSKLSLEYHHIHEKRRGGNKLNLQPHETDITEQTNYKIDGLNLNFQYFAPNQKHKIETYTSAQYIDRSSYYGTDMNPDAYGSTTDITALVGAQYVFSAKKFLFAPYDLTVGAEFNYNRMNDKIAAYNRDLLQNIYIGGLFLQNEWKHKDFSVLLGARLDKHNLVKLPVFSPRVNFRYNPLANLNLRLSYSSGYRAPQAYDEDLHVEAVGGQVSLISLDDNLRPEYSHSVSASADFYHSFGIVETNFLAEGFFTYLKDVFALVKTGTDAAGNSLLLRTNQSAAMVAGLSLETKVSIAKKFEIQLGYTFQKSQYIEDFQWSDNPNLQAQRKMFRSPDHYAYLMSNFYFPKNFGLSVFGNITGSMLLQHSAGFVPEDCEVSSPVFYDFGFKFSYDIKVFANAKLNLNIGIKNIFNSFQSDIDKGSLKDAGYMYGPSLPRTYFFGIKIEF